MELFSDAEYQVDSLDFRDGRIICGLSRTEGNGKCITSFLIRLIISIIFIVWDGKSVLMSTNGELISSANYPAGVSVIIFAPDGASTLAGADDGFLYLTEYSAATPSMSVRGHDDIISSILCWNENFLSVGWDGMLNVWSASDLRVSASSSIPDCCIYDACLDGAVAASEVITVGIDGFSRLWDLRALNSGCVQMINMNQIATACAPAVESRTTFVGLADGQVAAVDWRFPSILNSQRLHSGRVNSIRRLNGSQPNRFVSASDDSSALLFAASVFAVDEKMDDANTCSITRYVLRKFIIIMHAAEL
jgi:WD40 repeat protein